MTGLVHIVDDDELVRARLSYLLSNHGYSPRIYSGGGELLRDCDLQRGCIFLDLRMPRMSGHDVLEELARRGNALPVVAMSAYRDLPSVVRAMKLGAVDYVEKPVGDEDLLEAAARALAPPGTSAGRRNAALAAARLQRLTPRQREILQGVLDGLSNKEIARRLGLSPRTVEMHRAGMKVELGVASLAETVQFAVDAALTPLREIGRYEAAAVAGYRA
ncbi:MAG TPA: response regulator [Allosphingosinicella sp.]|nr:response regulator [Allosphingosinicella sp.]